MRIKLDIPISIQEVENLFVYSPSSLAPSKRLITHICTDSRICEKGDLFFAIKGDRFDGNAFTEDARNNGCICIASTSRFAHIQVKDTEDALLSLATYYKSKFKNLKSSIAITGSVGKSSTKEFLKKILSTKFITHANIGNYNNAIGVAHTIYSMPTKTECLICELGMNHSGEISRMSKCIEPNLGIVTNVGTSHLGNLGSRKAIAKAKSEITDGMKNGIVLIPYDEPLLENIPDSIKVGYNSSTSLSQFPLIKKSLSYDYICPDHTITDLQINLHEEHMLSNLSMAIAASMLAGLNDNEIRSGVSAIKESDLRQRFIKMRDYTIFDDSYNASYESIAADLKYLDKQFKKAPKGVFLGDIAELGNQSKAIHTSIGMLIPQFSISNLYLIGNYSKYIAKGAIDAGFDKSHIFINDDLNNHALSIEQITENHLSGEIILFKGSHSSGLYEIADILSEKRKV